VKEQTVSVAPYYMKCNTLGGTLSGPKRPVFCPAARIFFSCSRAAMACKNSLQLAKKGLFFVSDATTLTNYYEI
jgi:hypothetical protein